MLKINKDKEIEDLKNIVKWFIKKYSFGENEMAINPNEIKSMKEYELCEFRSSLTYGRIFKLIGNENYYERKFEENEEKLC